MIRSQVLGGEVGDADAAHQPLALQVDQRAPRLGVPALAGVGPVDQVQVEVVEAEPLQRLLGRGDRVVVAVVAAGDLAADRQLVPRYAGAPDRLAHLLLVAVVDRRVEQPVADLDRGDDRGDAVVAGEGVGAEPDRREVVPVVEPVGGDVRGGHDRHASADASRSRARRQPYTPRMCGIVVVHDPAGPAAALGERMLDRISPPRPGRPRRPARRDHLARPRTPLDRRPRRRRPAAAVRRRPLGGRQRRDLQPRAAPRGLAARLPHRLRLRGRAGRRDQRGPGRPGGPPRDVRLRGRPRRRRPGGGARPGRGQAALLGPGRVGHALRLRDPGLRRGPPPPRRGVPAGPPVDADPRAAPVPRAPRRRPRADRPRRGGERCCATPSTSPYAAG